MAARSLPLFEWLCACGGAEKVKLGLCVSCYNRQYHSLRNFGGKREQILARKFCEICDEGGRVVHHRRPHIRDRYLTLLCRSCHPKIHYSRRLRAWLPENGVKLWKELHPETPEQLQLPIDLEKVVYIF